MRVFFGSTQCPKCLSVRIERIFLSGLCLPCGSSEEFLPQAVPSCISSLSFSFPLSFSLEGSGDALCNTFFGNFNVCVAFSSFLIVFSNRTSDQIEFVYTVLFATISLQQDFVFQSLRYTISLVDEMTAVASQANTNDADATFTLNRPGQRTSWRWGP